MLKQVRKLLKAISTKKKMESKNEKKLGRRIFCLHALNHPKTFSRIQEHPVIYFNHKYILVNDKFF